MLQPLLPPRIQMHKVGKVIHGTVTLLTRKFRKHSTDTSYLCLKTGIIDTVCVCVCVASKLLNTCTFEI